MFFCDHAACVLGSRILCYALPTRSNNEQRLTDGVEGLVDDGRGVGAVHLDEQFEQAVGGLARPVRGEPFVEQAEARVGLRGPVAHVVGAVAQPAGQQAPVALRLHVH